MAINTGISSASTAKPAPLLTGIVETVGKVFGGKRRPASSAQWVAEIARLTAKLDRKNGQLIDLEARHRQAALDVELRAGDDAGRELAKIEAEGGKLKRQIARLDQALEAARANRAAAEADEAEAAHRREVGEHVATAAELKRLLAECDVAGRALAARAGPLLDLGQAFMRQQRALRPKATPDGRTISWEEITPQTISSMWAWFLKHHGCRDMLFGATAESVGSKPVGVDFAGELGALVDRLTIRE